MNKDEVKSVMHSIGDLYSSIPESTSLQENGLKDSLLEAYNKAHRFYLSMVMSDTKNELNKLSMVMPFSGSATSHAHMDVTKVRG